MIATFQELLGSLPEQEKTEEVIGKLKYFYDVEVDMLNRIAGLAKEPSVTLLPFSRCGGQYIADFNVKDITKPVEDKFNWHLQNTSQWLYAGCILVQDGRVSAHH